MTRFIDAIFISTPKLPVAARVGRVVPLAILAVVMITVVSCVSSSDLVIPDNNQDNGNQTADAPFAALGAYPDSGPAPLEVNLDGSGCWARVGGALTYDFDFDGDGNYDLLNAKSVVTHTFDEPGTYTVRLRVTDRNVKSTVVSTKVTVAEGEGEQDLNPVADLKAYPSTVDAGGEVTLDASACWARNGGALVYDYDYDGDGTYDLIDGPDSIDHVYTTAGTYNAKVRVTDTDNRSSTATVQVRVNGTGGGDTQGDNPPVASLAHFPQDVTEGQSVNLDASGSWARIGGNLRYDYDTNGDGTYDVLNGADNIDHVYNDAGTFNAKVRVTDGDGSYATATTQVVVKDGGGGNTGDKPVVALTHYPATVEEGSAVTLDASSSWARDGSSLTFDYDTNGDGSYDRLDAGNSIDHVYNTAGEYTPVVRATDGNGDFDTATTTVTVTPKPNTAPIARLVAEPMSGEVPFTVSFNASTSSDADGTIESYDWDLDGNGTYEVIDGAAAQQHQYTAAGEFTVMVRVTDDDGATDTESVVIDADEQVVANNPPVAALQADPLTGNAPLEVEFNATGSTDPDGNIVQYLFDFENDGIYDQMNTGGTITHTYNTQGDYTAKVEVRDGTDLSDTATVDIHVDEQPVTITHPPVAALSADPATGDAPLLVQFDATGSTDPDDNIKQYLFDFDGDGIYDAMSTSGMTSYTYNNPGTYGARVLVRDGDDLFDTETVQITVNEAQPGDKAPVARLSVNPAEADAPALVTLDATASTDADGVIVQYLFDFDGDKIFDEMSQTGTTQHTYTAGVYSARVQVRDDDGLSDIATATVTVHGQQNAHAPTARLSANPTTGTAPLNVNFNATASSDPDNDIEQYLFDFDGDGVYDTMSTSGTVMHTYETRGEYTARVQVRDAEGLTDTATVVITVEPGAEDMQPPIVVVIADPASGAPPLTTMFNAGPSLDLDGNIERFDWDMDNDGVFEIIDGGPRQEKTYPNAGIFYVNVRCVDNDGLEGTGMAVVVVMEGI